MSVRQLRTPIYVVECDEPGCDNTYAALPGSYSEANDRALRNDASVRGEWQVRPFSGPGSRKAPDLCPAHRRETS